jgi:hypothetical protein
MKNQRMSDPLTKKNLLQKLTTTLILSGIMAFATIIFDATLALLITLEFPQAGFLEFGLFFIWIVTSVLVVRRTGSIIYGVLAVAIVSIIHSTFGLFLAELITRQRIPGFLEPPFYINHEIQVNLFIAIAIASLSGFILMKLQARNEE